MSKPKKPLRFEYWKSTRNKQWYWRVRAGNAEPICQSEGYKTKAGVMKAFHALFDFEAQPQLVDLGAVWSPDKKPKHYEGKLCRSFP